MTWQDNILTDSAKIAALIRHTHTIAVLGIKTENQSDQPAFYVPQYLASAGFDTIPVPVYSPETPQILGRTVYRKLSDIPKDLDMVNVFRRSEDVPKHLD